MSKQVIQHKKAQFTLEPDGFSIHTFELSRRMTKHEWKAVKDRLYEGQKTREPGKTVWIYQEAKGCHRVTLYERFGVRVKLQHFDTGSHDAFYISMVVNPRKLIDPDSSYLGILAPKKSSMDRLEKAFAQLFQNSPFANSLEQYQLRRADLCVNIRCNHKKIFRETVRVLRKLPTPKKYKRVFSSHKDKKIANRINKHYLQFACGTHALVIYDKTFQMNEQGLAVDFEKLPEGVLRFEVQYQRKMLRDLEKKLGKDDPVILLETLIQESRQRICKHFSQCFADVRFCQREEIAAQIEASKFSEAHKKTMKELTARLQRKQSVDAALDELCKEGYDIDRILERFASLKISPIPLWNSFCAQSIPGPVELLKTIHDHEIDIHYIRKKSK